MLPHEVSAKTQAFTVFAAVRRETVEVVRNQVASGELHGHSFDSCFFGLFAKADGRFVGLQTTDRDYATEIRDRVVEFAASVGVPIPQPGKIDNPIEAFVLRIEMGDLPEEHPALATLLSWFDEWLEPNEEVVEEETVDEGELVTV